MTVKLSQLPPIVIGCDWGIALDCALDNVTDLTGYAPATDVDVYQLTDTGPAADPVATNTMTWAAGGAAAGVAQIKLTAAQTSALVPGRAIVRPVLVFTADGTRIPIESLAIPVEGAR